MNSGENMKKFGYLLLPCLLFLSMIVFTILLVTTKDERIQNIAVVANLIALVIWGVEKYVTEHKD